jgi:hypothetical protein
MQRIDATFSTLKHCISPECSTRLHLGSDPLTIDPIFASTFWFRTTQRLEEPKSFKFVNHHSGRTKLRITHYINGYIYNFYDSEDNADE